jgi:hypothetical protein
METSQPRLIPIAVDFYDNGHVFVVAAPSQEAFVLSFKIHHSTFAHQLCADATTDEDSFTRIRQAACIGAAYALLRQ